MAAGATRLPACPSMQASYDLTLFNTISFSGASPPRASGQPHQKTREEAGVRISG